MERLFEGIQRAGADIAEYNAEHSKNQRRGGVRARPFVHLEKSFQSNGWRTKIIASRCGPVEIRSMGTPAADRRAHWLADRPRRVFPRCWFSIQGDLRTPVHIARQAKRSMAAHRRGGRSDDNRCTGGWNQRRRARPIW